ncbi:STAS domain-containing protein [Actinoplanes sp. NPDC024001]|uniref:STAS domain-containing protein n=1 Tax=Actinoplanes sp. NPDC024001 TaxID=3154598 RepID=UPI00340FBAF7
MRISRQHDGDVVRVALAGELDLASSAGVRADLEQLVRELQPRRLLIDMGAVSFCDSTGLEALLCARSAAAERGVDFGLVNVHGGTLVTLQITGVLPLMVREPDAG